MIPLDECEFGEKTLPNGCFAIQVVGLLSRVEEAHFSKESREKLSELIEFNQSVAEIDILGAIENTIFVEDITLSGKVSLVGKEAKNDVFHVLDFVRGKILRVSRALSQDYFSASSALLLIFANFSLFGAPIRHQCTKMTTMAQNDTKICSSKTARRELDFDVLYSPNALEGTLGLKKKCSLKSVLFH